MVDNDILYVFLIDNSENSTILSLEFMYDKM